MEDMVCSMSSGLLSEIGCGLYNAFECISPMVGEIKTIMRSCGAEGVLMSGSGPSVFGLFSDDEKARLAVKCLSNNGYSTFLTNPTNGYTSKNCE